MILLMDSPDLFSIEIGLKEVNENFKFPEYSSLACSINFKTHYSNFYIVNISTNANDEFMKSSLKLGR